jgi:hypothetical protein
VQGFDLEDFQDQQIERALEEIDGFSDADLAHQQQHIRQRH